jgi:hypothetical protein
VGRADAACADRKVISVLSLIACPVATGSVKRSIAQPEILKSKFTTYG